MTGQWLVCASVVVGCGGNVVSRPVAKPAVVAESPVAAKAPPPVGEPEAPTAPTGYIEMTAAGVAAAGENAQAVGLIDAKGTLVLPIFIGGTEAMTIALRLYKQPFTRPLTHDLLDSVLLKLDAKIYKVQVDELVNGIFIGSVFIHRGAQVWELDARPSDAIAIAIGHAAPIYVSEKVLREAAQSGVIRSGSDGEKVTPKRTR